MMLLRNERRGCQKVMSDLINDKNKKCKRLMDTVSKVVTENPIIERDIERLRKFKAHQKFLFENAGNILA